MATNYITINQLSAIQALKNTDKILIARADGNYTGYITYSTALNTLSSAITCDVTSHAVSDILITSLNETQLNTTSKAPAGRVLLSTYTMIKDLSSNCLNVNSSAAKTIKGAMTFQTTPSAPNTSVATSNGQKLVNVNVLSSYVKDNVKTRSVGNQAPSFTYCYQVVTKNQDTSTTYENQTGSKCKLLVGDVKNGPIIHKCQADCTVVVTTYSTGTSFVVFGCNSDDATKISTKANIKTNQKTLSWHPIGRLATATDLTTFQLKAGTWLCFYMAAVWDSTKLKYIPKFSADFGSGDVIRIDEYR